MLVVDIIGTNVQYLSFRSFEQLYQTVPLGRFYYLNLCICYFILLLVILYSTSGIYLFRVIYMKLDP